MKRALLALLLLAACSGDPTDPLEQVRGTTGRLSGLVTIGPNCPVEQQNQPCPTPIAAYQARKVEVYDAARTRLLHTVDLDGRGFYLIDLAPADYVIDIRRVGIDRTSDVPKTVTIKAGNVTRVDISIDTGLR